MVISSDPETKEINSMLDAIEHNCVCIRNDSNKVVWECDLHYMLRKEPDAANRFLNLSSIRDRLIHEENSGPYADHKDM